MGDPLRHPGEGAQGVSRTYGGSGRTGYYESWAVAFLSVGLSPDPWNTQPVEPVGYESEVKGKLPQSIGSIAQPHPHPHSHLDTYQGTL